MRTRYGLTPHRVGELDGSRHTRGAKAFAHTAGWRRSRVGLGWTPATPAVFCRAGYSGGNAQSQRVARWSPSFRRGRAKEARARKSRRSATLTLLDVPLHVWRGAVLVRTRTPSRPEQRNNVARSSEGQPFTTGMNAWPSLWRLVQVPTWLPAVLHRRKRGRLLSTVA